VCGGKEDDAIVNNCVGCDDEEMNRRGTSVKGGKGNYRDDQCVGRCQRVQTTGRPPVPDEGADPLRGSAQVSTVFLGQTSGKGKKHERELGRQLSTRNT